MESVQEVYVTLRMNWPVNRIHNSNNAEQFIKPFIIPFTLLEDMVILTRTGVFSGHEKMNSEVSLPSADGSRIAMKLRSRKQKAETNRTKVGIEEHG